MEASVWLQHICGLCSSPTCTSPDSTSGVNTSSLSLSTSDQESYFYTLLHLVVAPHDQHKQERLSKTDNCIYYYLKLFTSVGLQNQSQHFSLSRVENSTGATLSFLYSAHRPVWLQQPDLRVWLLNIVQVPPVSGQCALWVCAQCRQWFRCKSPK